MPRPTSSTARASTRSASTASSRRPASPAPRCTSSSTARRTSSLAYLQRRGRSSCGRSSPQAGGASDDPDVLLDLVIDGIEADIRDRHTRGCPFINAAAEYPDDGAGARADRRSPRVVPRRRSSSWPTAAGLDGARRGRGIPRPSARRRARRRLPRRRRIASLRRSHAPRAGSSRRTAPEPSRRVRHVPHRPHESHQTPDTPSRTSKNRRNPRIRERCRVHSRRSIRPAGGRSVTRSEQ